MILAVIRATGTPPSGPNIDLDGAKWRYTVTKTNTPHVVPLARQAVEILRELHPLTGYGWYVFPNARYSGPVKNPRTNREPLGETERRNVHRPWTAGVTRARCGGASSLLLPVASCQVQAHRNRQQRQSCVYERPRQRDGISPCTSIFGTEDVEPVPEEQNAYKQEPMEL